MDGVNSLHIFFFFLYHSLIVSTFYSPCSLFDFFSVCNFAAYLNGFSFSLFVEYDFIDKSSNLWQSYSSQLKLL